MPSAVTLGRMKSSSSARFWIKAPLSQGSHGCICRGGQPGRGHRLLARKTGAKDMVKGREAAGHWAVPQILREQKHPPCSPSRREGCGARSDLQPLGHLQPLAGQPWTPRLRPRHGHHSTRTRTRVRSTAAQTRVCPPAAVPTRTREEQRSR